MVAWATPYQVKAEDTQLATVRARVIEIIHQDVEDINPFGDQIGETPQMVVVQEIRAKILEGETKNTIISFTNDHTPLHEGDYFYLSLNPQPDGTIQYLFSSFDRSRPLLLLLGLFVVLVVLFGSMQGLRGLMSLGGSLVLIGGVLVPGLLYGFSPILISLGVASCIIIAGSYITHGFNKTTTSAVLGMIATMLITGGMAYYAIHATGLRGFDEHALYLSIRGFEDINLLGLLFGGIIIGLLGVLYDASISQAIAVEELHAIAPHKDRWEIYKRGMRIGREHIGALVDTIAIAYVGASLPLILLYAKSGQSIWSIINQEFFATEIVRILVSSMGLILAVPITTLIAVYVIIKKSDGGIPRESTTTEEEKIQRIHHH